MTKTVKISCLFLVALLLNVIFAHHSFAKSEMSGDAHFKADLAYKIGSGDKLKITIFDEPDLSGEYDIDGEGILSMPLIGNIEAGGYDLRSLENEIATSYKEGYLKNPRINIEIMNFRPFFILGEVNEPGSYPYVSGITVINAVALAGGFTHRARTDRVVISRGKGNEKKEFDAKEDFIVMPGDSIRVTERFF